MILAELPSTFVFATVGLLGFVLGAATFYLFREDRTDKSIYDIKRDIEIMRKEQTSWEVGKNGLHKR